MAETKPEEPTILSLETIFTRPQVSIDGALYDITSPGELTIQQSYRIGVLSRQLTKKRAEDGLTEAAQNQLSETLNELTEIILEPVPTEVRAKLKDAQRLAMVEVFTMLLSEDRLTLAGATVMKMINRYLGENKSPGSSVSTAEAQKAG